MHITRDGRFERTDIWREGKWLDLWSVVHLLSGVSIGLGVYLLHLGTSASIIIVFVLLTSYELWEKLVGIHETPQNRVMDVVVGMASFLPTFLILAPLLSVSLFILVSGFVLTATLVMSAFGWIASQKAAELKARMRARYARERTQLTERAAHLREKLHLKRPDAS